MVTKFMCESSLKFNLFTSLSIVSTIVISIVSIPASGFAATPAQPNNDLDFTASLAQATPTIRPDFQRPIKLPIEEPKPQLPPSQEILPTVPAPIPIQPTAPGNPPH